MRHARGVRKSASPSSAFGGAKCQVPIPGLQGEASGPSNAITPQLANKQTRCASLRQQMEQVEIHRAIRVHAVGVWHRSCEGTLRKPDARAEMCRECGGGAGQSCGRGATLETPRKTPPPASSPASHFLELILSSSVSVHSGNVQLQRKSAAEAGCASGPSVSSGLIIVTASHQMQL
jgi:hypothetical protein